jgi:hypothetical protein
MPPPKFPTLLRPLTAEWDWQLLARCRFMDGDLFFPREDESRAGRIRRERIAKDICASCAVLLECRDHALAAGERHGVGAACPRSTDATTRWPRDQPSARG